MDIPSIEWNRLASAVNNPFLEWEWLYLLEASKSVCAQTAWQPAHICVRANGRLVGAAPLYIRQHSIGEFVFDFGWAELAHQLGIAYYPKIVGMVPFTPVSGYRFLLAEEGDREKITHIILSAIQVLASHLGIKSCNLNYIDTAWKSVFKPYGYHLWKHENFIWYNEQYRSFDDYQNRFNKNQRRNIRRERQAMKDCDIDIIVKHAEDVPVNWFDLMIRYYNNTNDQFGGWAARYLTPDFFMGLREKFRHRILFCGALEKNGSKTPIALSLLFHKGQNLFGRYWGAQRPIPMLHFNICYYGPIEWAIERQMASFDGGIGSPHKLRRGFRAVANYSAHRFFDAQMQAIFANNIGRINIQQQKILDENNDNRPIKQ